MLIEVAISFVGHMLLKKRDVKRAFIIVRTLIESFKNLRIPFSKRTEVSKIKMVRERKINRAMSILVDAIRIAPARVYTGDEVFTPIRDLYKISEEYLPEPGSYWSLYTRI